MKLVPLLALSCLLGLTVACESTNQNRSQSGRGLPEANTREKEPSRGDRRVALVQNAGAGQTLLILVNEGHALRATQEGRVRLANGNPNQAYNVLTESAMQALLDSIANQGFNDHAREAQPADENWFRGSRDANVNGAVLVEDGADRRFLLGQRPRNDPALVPPYQVFVQVKGVVALWTAGRTEVPATSHVIQ